MAITTMDGLVSALGTSQDAQLFFPSATNVAGGWIWLNYASASSFSKLALPIAYTSGGILYLDNSIAGFPAWSAGNTNTYIGRWGQTFATAGTTHLYDTYWACSGFNGTVTTAQAVTNFAGLPPRAGTGVGCEIWIYCSTATGATAANITVQYTNSSGVSGRNTVSTSHITSMPANRMYQVPLQSGDVGVKSIQSVTLSASTGTAGAFGVIIMNRLASISSPVPNVASVSDFASLGLPQINDTSCLSFIHQATTTSSGIIMGQLSIIQG